MKKRTNTAKWIESAKRWQINVQKDGVRKTFTSSVPGRNGQRLCNEKADEWLDNNIDGSIKLSAMYDKWLEEVKLLKGTGTYTNYESYGRIHIKPLLGKKKMNTLSEQDFQNVINAAFKKGLAYKTLGNLRGCMQTFLKYCRKNKTTTLILENIEISDKAPKKEKRVLQPDNFKVLLRCKDIKHFWYLNAFKLFAVTGMREGELIALKKNDYYNGTLAIRHSINKFGELTEGKTKNTKRDFILLSIADKIIKEQLKQIEGLKTDYLFPNPFGEVSSGHTIYGQWQRFCKSYEIPPTSIHELRHTFISMCKDVPLELLKQVVGHSNSMDTFGQYGHELHGDKEKAKKLIEKEINKISRFSAS